MKRTGRGDVTGTSKIIIEYVPNGLDFCTDGDEED